MNKNIFDLIVAVLVYDTQVIYESDIDYDFVPKMEPIIVISINGDHELDVRWRYFVPNLL